MRMEYLVEPQKRANERTLVERELGQLLETTLRMEYELNAALRRE